MAETSGETAAKIQAIVLATSDSDAFGTIVEHAPVELMPLANQPFIGRVVGTLASLGVRDIAVLASHRVDLFSNYLGDGTRWGARIKVIAVASEAQAFARLPELVGADCAVIGRASVLPQFSAENVRQRAGVARFTLPGGAGLGWLIAPRAACGDAVRECKSLEDFEKLFVHSGRDGIETPAPALRCGSAAELLQATHALLDGLRPEQIIPGASAEKGVYISHSVVIHPTARIKPPVIIGANCSIERGVQIGPYAVIGEGTILGEHTTLEDAVVLPGTYIGPHLELAHVVVDHHSLAYRDAKGAVPVPDPFLLSANEELGLGEVLRQIVRRLCGLAALLLLWPLLLYFYLIAKLMGAKKPIRRMDAVCLPTAADPALWRTFAYYEFDAHGPASWQRMIAWLRLARLPALWNVLRGDVAWIGVRPLTPEEVSALPSDWRQLYRSGKVGIIRLAELDQVHAGENSDDQIYSSEAYYVATATVKTDLRIFWRAIWSGRPREPRPEESGAER